MVTVNKTYIKKHRKMKPFKRQERYLFMERKGSWLAVLNIQ